MIQLIHQFVILAETNNFSRASEKLYISQPALSKNIKKLENLFNCTLLERSKSGSQLTSFGRILYRHAKVIDDEMDSLYSEMDEALKFQMDHLTVAYGIFWQILYAAKIMLTMEKSTDNQILITSKNGSTESMLDEVLKGRCDIFMGKIPDVKDSRLNYEPLLETRHSIFSYKDHPVLNAEQQVSPTLSDLSRYKWLIFGSKDDLPGYDIPDILKQKVEIRTIHDVNSIFIILQVIQNSDALIILPRKAGLYLAEYGVREVKVEKILFNSYKSGLIYKAERQYDPIIHKARSVILEAMKDT